MASLVMCALGAVGIAALAIDAAFVRMDFPSPYIGDARVWGHRGYWRGGLRQNSIESLADAFDRGAGGVELDLFYDPDRRDYIVSHDFPYASDDGKLLALSAVLERLASRGGFWLEIKNLGSLSAADNSAAAQHMRTLLEHHSLLDRAFVESSRADRLQQFAREGILTCLWIAPPRPETTSPLTLWLYLTRAKLEIVRHSVSAISIKAESLTPEVEALLAPAKMHVFTVNDRATLERLLTWPSVGIILTDEDLFAVAEQDLDGAR